jgi:hypothetical protein
VRQEGAQTLAAAEHGQYPQPRVPRPLPRIVNDRPGLTARASISWTQCAPQRLGVSERVAHSIEQFCSDGRLRKAQALVVQLLAELAHLPKRPALQPDQYQRWAI